MLRGSRTRYRKYYRRPGDDSDVALGAKLEDAKAGPLPPFLQPLVSDNLPESSSTGNPYHNAVFPESDGIQPVHVHWWPCKATDAAPPQTVLLFIPGNPGVIDFYSLFLNTVYDSDTSERLAILTYSHVGHAPSLDSKHSLTLVQNALRITDAIKSTFGASVRIVVAGHSVGAWFALQASSYLYLILKFRPGSISSAFLLLPTIAEIADTPNGRKLSWLFRAPLPRSFAIYPSRFLGMLFPSYPPAALNTLHSFLRSPQAIFASMSMAHDEMIRICELDAEFLDKHRDLLCFYFAENDEWVDKQRDAILEAFGGNEPRIVNGASGVPHAFCINHSEEIARHCYEWLVSGGFL
ncbi:hypothetical protein BU15DRAFT_86903 [Melanogaster broomeanus]|nr:hypothetical protein BU15DRAFT_86903 [Melanogaster broomeanus]